MSLASSYLLLRETPTRLIEHQNGLVLDTQSQPITY